MPSSERRKEINRRRRRKKKLPLLHQRIEKANDADKEELVQKVRDLTPGAPVILQAWGLAQD